MLRLYVPVAVTVVLIAALTFWEGLYSDRFRSSSIDAAEFGKRFASLPMEVGAWKGEDHKVDEKTLEVAGAVNHVSRTYTNAETNQSVDLWLIVGHARDVGRHTPDVCYIAQGFAQDGTKQKHRVEVSGEEPSSFYTARFRREDQPGAPTRVFWTWNANEEEEHDWVAPDNQRTHFGNNTALYKMYFTARMPDRDEPVADNVAMDFAKVMLPVVNRALFPERYAGTATATPEAAAEAAATEAADAAATEVDPTGATPAVDPTAATAPVDPTLGEPAPTPTSPETLVP